MKIGAQPWSAFEGIVFWILPTVKAIDSVEAQHDSQAPQ